LKYTSIKVNGKCLWTIFDAFKLKRFKNLTPIKHPQIMRRH